MFDFDCRQDPILWMRLTGEVTEEDDADYAEALAMLAARRRPFGLVNLVDICGGSAILSLRRRQAIWFKAERDKLARLCVGLVRVRPKLSPTHAEEDKLAQVLPFPTALVTNEREGQRLIEAWVAAREDLEHREPLR